MSYSPTLDHPDKTPLYRLAVTTLQTGVFDKGYTDNPPAGWFYKYPGIGRHFKLPDISANEHLLDDLCETGKVTKPHTAKIEQLLSCLRRSKVDYDGARAYITLKRLEEELNIWAEAVEELWHDDDDFTQIFHERFLHEIGLCLPTLLNRHVPSGHPYPLHSRIFAARKWDLLSELDEDMISKLSETWQNGLGGMQPPNDWVQESYRYYWALAKAEYVRNIQELDDILLAIIRVYLSHSVNHLNNQTELKNPHAGTIPVTDSDSDHKPDPIPTSNREMIEILEDKAAELEQDLEHDAWELLGRKAKAVPSTSVPSLPEHLRKVRGGLLLSLRAKSSPAIASYSFEISRDSSRP
jgi:hypothetical protein